MSDYEQLGSGRKSVNPGETAINFSSVGIPFNLGNLTSVRNYKKLQTKIKVASVVFGVIALVQACGALYAAIQRVQILQKCTESEYTSFSL